MLLVLVLLLAACRLSVRESNRSKLEGPVESEFQAEVEPTPDTVTPETTPEPSPEGDNGMNAERIVPSARVVCIEESMQVCYESTLVSVSVDETGNVYTIEGVDNPLILVAIRISDGQVDFLSSDTLLEHCPVESLTCTFSSSDYGEVLFGKPSNTSKDRHISVRVLRAGDSISLYITSVVAVPTIQCGRCTLA